MKPTRILFFVVILLLFVACQEINEHSLTQIPSQTVEDKTDSPTQAPIFTLNVTNTALLTETPTRFPTATITPWPTLTPTETPTQGPSPTPRPETTYAVIRPTEAGQVDIQATYTAIAADYDNRMATMLPPLAAYESAPRELGWREYRIEEIGLTMQLPQDWSDMDYRSFTPRQSSMFKVKNYGVMTSSAMVVHEGIIMHI